MNENEVVEAEVPCGNTEKQCFDPPDTSGENRNRLSEMNAEEWGQIAEKLRPYLPSQLFEKIIREKGGTEIGLRRTRLTVFFSHLKNFSYISTRMEGEVVAEFLNFYLNAMSRIISRWNGTLDKYMGDSIMVFFGDPEFTSDEDHALRCVLMAIEMREKMKSFRKKWYDMGYQEPLASQMGIATGYCTVGNFGSPERMNYTAIGTPVNLAGRLAMAVDSDEIFISHETWGYVREKIVCTPPEKLHLKGFEHELLAHRVLYANEEKSSVLFMKDEPKGVTIKIDSSRISKDEVFSIISEMYSQSETQE